MIHKTLKLSFLSETVNENIIIQLVYKEHQTSVIMLFFLNIQENPYSYMLFRYPLLQWKWNLRFMYSYNMQWWITVRDFLPVLKKSLLYELFFQPLLDLFNKSYPSINQSTSNLHNKFYSRVIWQCCPSELAR